MALPIKQLGDRLAPASVGPRQVVAVPATKVAQPPIQANRWFRNGRHPNAAAVSMLNEAVNQAALYRTKEYFSIIRGPLGPSSTAGDRARWRFAFRTGPYQHAAYAIVNMRPPNAGHNANTAARLEIRNGAGTLITSTVFEYGPSPTGTEISPLVNLGYNKPIAKFIDGLAVDTEYFATFFDVNYGRLQSATVFECPSMTQNTSGYLGQNVSAQTPVVDVYREKQATILRELWRKGGAKVMNWTVDNGTTPVSVTTTTPTNIFDGTSTTYGAAIPGPTFDMTGKARVSQASSGVPVKIWAYLDTTGANGAILHLRDSAGVSLASITATTIGTPGWYSTTVSLPASSAKYYLTLQSTSGAVTARCYAVSIYEHET